MRLGSDMPRSNHTYLLTEAKISSNAQKWELMPLHLLLPHDRCLESKESPKCAEWLRTIFRKLDRGRMLATQTLTFEISDGATTQTGELIKPQLIRYDVTGPRFRSFTTSFIASFRPKQFHSHHRCLRRCSVPGLGADVELPSRPIEGVAIIYRSSGRVVDYPSD